MQMFWVVYGEQMTPQSKVGHELVEDGPYAASLHHRTRALIIVKFIQHILDIMYIIHS